MDNGAMMESTYKRYLNQHYLAWWFTNCAKKLGIFGLLGLAILLGCGLFYAASLLPLQKKIATAEFDLSEKTLSQNRLASMQNNALQISPNQPPAAQAPADIASADDIKSFYAQFPNGASLPQWLRLMNEQALKQKLILNQGDYKLTQIKPAKNAEKQNQPARYELARYEIVLPVTGQYTQIRQFIAQVLHQLPALALNDVQIKRENVQTATVEARLVFILLLRGDAWQ